MKLYEIDRAILDCIDGATGEVVDLDRLSQLSMERNTKIDNISCWYKQLTAEVTAIDNEIQALSDRRDSKRNKAESLKRFLSDILYGLPFESARNRISWRRSDEVQITDEEKIPVEYKTERLEVVVNKADVKKAIKAGITIDGAELIAKNNIQIK